MSELPDEEHATADLAITEQVASFLSCLDLRIPFRDRPLSEVRLEHRDEALSGAGSPDPVAIVEQLNVGGVPVRLYRPRGDEDHALLWFHGGGWMLGDLDCCDAVVRALATSTGCAAIAVDYRLAPEHRYPAAVEDCWAVTEWAAERFSRVAVGGDSAGGNLAAAIAIRARTTSVSLAMQLLVYPVLRPPITETYAAFGRRYELFAGIRGYGAWYEDTLRYMWDEYVPDPANRLDECVSPLHARDLTGLPTTFMVAAEHDLLFAEGEEYMQRLRGAGVPASGHTYPGQIHGFFPLVGLFDEARDAVARLANALTAAFGATSA